MKCSLEPAELVECFDYLANCQAAHKQLTRFLDGEMPGDGIKLALQEGRADWIKNFTSKEETPAWQIVPLRFYKADLVQMLRDHADRFV